MAMLIDSLKSPKYKAEILRCLKYGDNGESGDALYKILHDAKCFYIPDKESVSPAIHSIKNNIKIVPDLFKLPHNPMVMEILDSGARIAIFLWKTEWERGEAYEGLYFEKDDITKEVKCPILFGFDPKTLKEENGITYFNQSMLMLEPDKLTPRDDDGFSAVMINIMFYVCMINSPKIIELEKVDYERLNKTREKKGKEPLTNYSIIKLQATIRQQLSQEGNRHGVSFHWRRGHFKAKPKGLTWWNPHTVGDKKYGETKSAYLV